MALLTGDAYFQDLIRGYGLPGARAQLGRAQSAPRVEDPESIGRDAGYLERFGAAFSHDANILGALWDKFHQFDTQFLPEEENFNPADHLGEYRRFVNEAPELLRARSSTELAVLKNRIDDEMETRRTLENMGFFQALAVYLPAGLISPENMIPIGAAFNAARLGKGVMQAGLRAGFENFLLEGGAQQIYDAGQLTRTGQEKWEQTIGAGLFGAILGSSAAGLGAGRRAATQALLGAETVSGALDQANEAMLQSVAKGKAGREIMDVISGHQDGFIRDQEAYDRVGGILRRELNKHNPKLARILKADAALTKLISKAMFFGPGPRTTNSPNAATRVISDFLVKNPIVKENTIDMAPVEQVLKNFELVGHIQLHRVEDVFTRYAESGGRVPEEAFFDIAGKAAGQQKALDENLTIVWDGVEVRVMDHFGIDRNDHAFRTAVDEIRKVQTEWREAMRKTGEAVGAWTDGLYGDFLAAASGDEGISRGYRSKYLIENEGAAKQNFLLGLHARKEQFQPDFEAEIGRVTEVIDDLNAELEIAGREMPGGVKLPGGLHKHRSSSEIESDIRYYEGLKKEAEVALVKIADEAWFEEVAEQVFENLTRKSTGGLKADESNNPLLRKVLDLDEKYLQQYLNTDIRVDMMRSIRRVLPDFVVSNHMHLALDGTPLLKRLNTQVGELRERITRAEDFRELHGEELRAIEAELENLDEAGRRVAMEADLNLILPDTLKRLGGDLEELRARVGRNFDARARIRGEIRTREAAIADLEKNQPFDKETPKALLEEIEGLKEELRGQGEAINHVAKALGMSLGGTQSQVRKSNGVEPLGFKRARGRTETQRARDLVMRSEKVFEEVATHRRQAYQIHVGEEQAERFIKREIDKMEGDKKLAAQKRQRKDIDDISTMMQRLRNRHGIAYEASDWAKADKIVRDLNYSRLLGGVTLSSIPDLAMAVGTAGLGTYVRALGKWLNREYVQKNRNHLADLIYASETVLGMNRTREVWGLTDFVADGPPAYATGLDRTLDWAADKSQRLANLTSKWTFINKWNGFNKSIAAIAIQHRIIKNGLNVDAGRVIPKAEKEMLREFGVTPERAAEFAREWLAAGANRAEDLGTPFYYAQSEKWKSRDNTIEFQAVVRNAVDRTILTMNAGTLPTSATKYTLFRNMLQFRSFSFAATEQFAINGVQRVFQQGDMAPAYTAALATMFGAGVYMMREAISGRNPWEDTPGTDEDPNGVSWIRKAIAEGLDRSGALGILADGMQTSAKVWGASPLTALAGDQLTRFQSRNPIDAFAGPTFGFFGDFFKVIQSAPRVWGEEDFSVADAKRLRRMIPLQNLVPWGRLFDVAPNLLNDGGYFKDYMPLEERLRNSVFGEEDVLE